MNRRSFISTIAALTGLAIAKIKAPAKPVPPPAVMSGNEYFRLSPDVRHGIAGECLYAGDMVVFKNNKIYRYPH